MEKFEQSLIQKNYSQQKNIKKNNKNSNKKNENNNNNSSFSIKKQIKTEP